MPITISKNILLLCGCLSLFSCAIETKDVVQPEQKIEKVKKIEIDKTIILKFDQAKKYLNNKQYQSAIDLLHNIIKTDDRFAAPFINLAIAYERLGNNKQTEKYLHKALNIDLTNVVANNELGILYRQQGRFSDARKAYENALLKHPNNLLILRNFGILCDLYLSDLSCAQQLYKKYLDISDNKKIKIWLLDLERRM